MLKHLILIFTIGGLLLAGVRPSVGATKSDSLVLAAWKAWETNDHKQVEQKFQAAIQADPGNTRAYLGLSFLYTYQRKYGASWAAFKNVLKTEADFYPYVYAVWATPRFRNNFDSSAAGALTLLAALTQKAEATGILSAMAGDVLGQYYQTKNDTAAAKRFYRRVNSIDEWMLIGPFDNISASGYDNVFPPEQEYNPAKTYRGKNGVPAQWFKIAARRNDRWIDFNRYFAYKQAAFYANNFVYSPAKQTVQIRLGTSGALKVFLNDEPVIECFDENNNDLDTYIVETDLQAGWNRLLIKCASADIDPCNFLARITDAKGEPLPGLKVSTAAQRYKARPGAKIKTIANFAETFFQQKIKAEPSHLENYILLAESYLRNDKAVEAELILRDAIKRSPDCALLYNHILEAYRRGEKYDEVATAYEKIYALDPDALDALENKVERLLNTKDFDQAETLIKRVETLAPASELSYTLALGLYGKKNQMEKILEINAAAYKKYPNHWDFVYLETVVAMQANRNFDRAIEILEAYIRDNRSASALYQLAEAYLKAARVEQWEKTMWRALEIDPAASGYLHYMAGVFVAQQKYEQAENAIRQAIAICPNSSTFWAKLGDIHRAKNEPAPAKQAYRQALSFLPTNYAVREALRELEGKKSPFALFAAEDVNALVKNAPSAEAYPNDNGVVLLDDTKRVIYADGPSESVSEILIKVFNAKGIDDFKEYWMGYNSYTQTLTVDKAVVIKRNGAEIKADLDGGHAVFKALEQNDCIYLKWKIKNYYNGKLAQHFWDTFYFNGSYPVKKSRYTLLAPANFKFKFNAPGLAPAKATTDDGVIYEWAVADEPAIEYEYSMPSYGDVGKILHLSSIENWAYLVEWYSDLARTKTRSSFEIKEQVQALFEGKENISADARLKIIYAFITENIRYSSVSFRQSGLIPQKARDVLVNRLGDCKDKATLCIAMLAEAGIKAHYVLVNTSDQGQNRQALPSIAFNHCIVAVETPGGLKHLDLTAYNYPLGAVPHTDVNGFALLIRSGNQTPEYLPDHQFLPNNTFRRSRISLRDDNSMTAQIATQKTGIAGASTREYYRHRGPKEQEKLLLENLADDLPDARLHKFDFGDLHRLDSAVPYSYEYEVPNYVTESGPFKYLKIPWADNQLTNKAFSYETRKFPLYWLIADTLVEEMEIKLPTGYEPLELTGQASFTSAVADYVATYSYADGSIKARRQMINRKAVVTPEEYVEFKKFYNNVVKEDARQILLKRK